MLNERFNYWTEIGEVKACRVFLVAAKIVWDLLFRLLAFPR